MLQPSPGQPSPTRCSEFYTILSLNHAQLNDITGQHVCFCSHRVRRGSYLKFPLYPPQCTGVLFTQHKTRPLLGNPLPTPAKSFSENPSFWTCLEHYWCRCLRSPSNIWARNEVWTQRVINSFLLASGAWDCCSSMTGTMPHLHLGPQCLLLGPAHSWYSRNICWRKRLSLGPMLLGGFPVYWKPQQTPGHLEGRGKSHSNAFPETRNTKHLFFPYLSWQLPAKLNNLMTQIKKSNSL